VAQLVYDVTGRICDRMVDLVEQMLAARKHLAGAQSERDKDLYTNRCVGDDCCPSLAAVVNSQPLDISLRSFFFAALTPAEIQIVEGYAK
jgi:hypothetical protein